jgi:hypothetical protein
MDMASKNGIPPRLRNPTPVDNAAAALSLAVKQLAIAIVVVLEHRRDLGQPVDGLEGALARLALNQDDLRSALSEPPRDPSALLSNRIQELRAVRHRFVRAIAEAADPESSGIDARPSPADRDSRAQLFSRRYADSSCTNLACHYHSLPTASTGYIGGTVTRVSSRWRQ